MRHVLPVWACALMRLVLLASIAWVVTLTEPLFHIFEHPFSGRDLILLFGGVFLLFKAPWSCMSVWKPNL